MKSSPVDRLFVQGGPFFVIAGPCVLEDDGLNLSVADALARIADDLSLPIVYKASFDKANRSKPGAARGPGIEEGLRKLARVKADSGLPVLTDVHEADQCAPVADVCDVLQIPAFLSRQTDLLVAAAHTGKAVNVKKGQFLSPWDMKNVIAKITGAGNPDVLVTERGVSFGYNTLVSDMRALPIMKEIGCPVVFDATHSVQ
ncbi:MAG TPA: 3-deoxy-8-phosphooctulonate synthase, partial [Longimicrobiales bacterium]